MSNTAHQQRKSLAAIKAALSSVSDDSVDPALRRAMLVNMLMDDGPLGDAFTSHVFGALGAQNGELVYQQKCKKLDELLQQLDSGTVRKATFLGWLSPAPGASVSRAEVVFENGDTAYPVAPDPKLSVELKRGDDVLTDGQARVVLRRQDEERLTGEIAELAAVLDKGSVEVNLNDRAAEVFLTSALLQPKLDAGEVQPGARLLVCQRRRIALRAVPPRAGVSAYRYLDIDPIPDIQLDRDLGCPPAYISELLQHLKREMLNPELPRKYRQRRMQTRLLTGVTGSGKTLSINAFIAAMYKLLSEITRAPIETLPRRVLRLRPPQILSKWLGDSDKNLDRFFDEAIQLEQTLFIGPDGRQWKLPVVCCCEEIDALARARGSSDAVYDRIQTTALERLDHLSKGMGDRLIVLLFTTNIVEACDTAFVRRAGGEIIRFGRIGRPEFAAILSKHLAGLPIRPDHGPAQAGEARICRDVTNWMFSEQGHDPGQLELTFAGSSTPIVKRRRDLLTPAVVDLSVQQVARDACRLEEQGFSSPGVTSAMVMAALDKQVRSICNRVNQFNAHEYVTLPDGARVASVSRIAQPSVQRFELDRSLS